MQTNTGTVSRLMVVQGQEGTGRRDYKESEETSGDEKYVHYLDCSDGCTAVYKCQIIQMLLAH